MDRFEYGLKVEQIKKLLERKDYSGAKEIADGVEWKREKNPKLLSEIAELYVHEKDAQTALKIYNYAYNVSSRGLLILERMTELALIYGQIDLAEELCEEYRTAGAYDADYYLFKVQIAESKGEGIDERIFWLEKYCSQELDEEALYRLAMLYDRAEREKDCVKICDYIINFFCSGETVDNAIQLKQKYEPLTKYQEDRVTDSAKFEENYKKYLASIGANEEPAKQEAEEEEKKEQETKEDHPKEESEDASRTEDEKDDEKESDTEEPVEIREEIESTREVAIEDDAKIASEIKIEKEVEAESEKKDEEEALEAYLEKVVADDKAAAENKPQKENATGEPDKAETGAESGPEAEKKQQEELEAYLEKVVGDDNKAGKEKGSENENSAKEPEEIKIEVESEEKSEGDLEAEKKEREALKANLEKLITDENEENPPEDESEPKEEKEAVGVSDLELVVPEGSFSVICSDMATGVKYAMELVRMGGKRENSDRVAKISAVKVNKSGFSTIEKKLDGNILLITGAGKLKGNALEGICAWTGKSEDNRVILVDDKDRTKDLNKRSPKLMEKLEKPYFYEEKDVSEWMELVEAYAKENGCVLADDAKRLVEAYLRDKEEREDVVIGIKLTEAVQDALSRAKKNSMRNFISSLMKTKNDGDGLIILRDRHFT